MTIMIVIPVLALLMFELGLTLSPDDFKMVVARPRAVFVGLAGQLLLLPLIALALVHTFHLDPVFLMGLMLIACCPGGSSSNVFSLLAKGDVALSVSLTALSSVLTLLTIPIVMSITAGLMPDTTAGEINLPVTQLIAQNIVLTLLPVAIGMLIRSRWTRAARRTSHILEKAALPLLVLLVLIFYTQNHQQIRDNISTLGIVVALLVLFSIGGGMMLSKASRLDQCEVRTITIEVGMQNAAQAIAIASSPFVFNNETMAIPAIIYSLFMNLALIPYVFIVRRRKMTSEE